MKILVDCDVLLDVGTGRMPHAADSQQVLDWCERHPGNGFIAWHTIANVFYLLQKGGRALQARQFIHDLLTFIEVVPAGTSAAKHALALPMTDFEDGLQCAAAVQAGVDFIVTRNINDYSSAPVTAILPGVFLSQAPA
ncbi:type II toxin-antitoxin system VapC family toxin [Prosthecobacter sp.]|uniref:type II toxin-antitoxin system VapC family toxin n=1 Tax=Prosthecobacter sp. TaxID=1965333 RepID=UPI0037843633